MPGLDADDPWCSSWAVYSGTVQTIGIAGAFGELRSVDIAALELIGAAPDLPETEDAPTRVTPLWHVAHGKGRAWINGRPATLAQAGRIPGVTPAAISLLLIHLKKRGWLERRSA